MPSNADINHLTTVKEVKKLTGYSIQYISRMNFERLHVNKRQKDLNPIDVRNLILKKGGTFKTSMILVHSLRRKSGTTTLVRNIADWAVVTGHRVLIINACWDRYLELSYGINIFRTQGKKQCMNFVNRQLQILSIWDELNPPLVKKCRNFHNNELQKTFENLKKNYDIILVDIPSHTSPNSKFLFDTADQIVIPINLCTPNVRMDQVTQAIERQPDKQINLVPIYAYECTGDTRKDNDLRKKYSLHSYKINQEITNFFSDRIDVHEPVPYDLRLSKAHYSFMRNLLQVSDETTFNKIYLKAIKSKFIYPLVCNLLELNKLNIKSLYSYCNII